LEGKPDFGSELSTLRFRDPLTREHFAALSANSLPKTGKQVNASVMPHAIALSYARCGRPKLRFFSSPFLHRPLACCPHQPASQGAGRGSFRGILPLAALLRGLFRLKGDRPRANSSKKKTMKNKKLKNLESGLKNRIEQQSKQMPKIDFRLRRANRMLDTEHLLALLRSETAGFFEVAEVVGKWVWISFPDKQSCEVTRVLSQLGFHWNNLRRTWQHPCGTLPVEAATYDPRRRYGSYFAADVKPA
jgi:hypothetical protein